MNNNNNKLNIFRQSLTLSGDLTLSNTPFPDQRIGIKITTSTAILKNRHVWYD